MKPRPLHQKAYGKDYQVPKERYPRTQKFVIIGLKEITDLYPANPVTSFQPKKIDEKRPVKHK